MIKRFYFYSVVIGYIFLASCNGYPYSSDYLSDYDIVYTSYDEDANFGKYSTYIVPTKIPYLTDTFQAQTYLDDDLPAMADLIRSEIRSTMNERGYTEVPASDSTAHLMVNVGISSSDKTATSTSSCWWYSNPYYWSWYDNWYWDYNYYWDSYPCYNSYNYSYQTGSLFLDIIDIQATNAQNCNSNNSNCTLANLWNGVINGLLSNDNQNLANRIQKGIRQAFSQSQYIKK